MVNEIAVYINKLDEIADLNETGIIKIFSKDNNWRVIRELPFKFHSTKGKEDIRLDTLNIAEILGSCKIFVAKEFSDLAYTMLEGLGVSTWKMKGRSSEVLDYILEKEKEEAEEIKIIDSENFNDKNQTVKPMEIGNNGCYILNVRELQDRNIGITTKQALMPFLNEGNFNELILTCSHIPGWLESYLTKLNFNFQFSEVGEGDYLIIVNKK
ncbi:Nitrogenase iron-iron accessory protein AnfO [Clostridium sp. DL-VIII]|uniref:Fe-only nitrogenase accessory AnfO family protein n=1 Tax=Clostridium sp. DL-VIII TaxID=641107 RepID=UPI00023AFE9F|nr:Fe-only nitrogenase accessory AnfO family protein [Clostridium sp. DL-VIII]EHI99685.1 Nitrogenase iron-iron accessory protein AnfO [Clostridium sp. DL-VIII]